MATISIESQTLSVELGTWDKIWAFHGSLHVPLAHITSVQVADQAAWARAWTKLVGTSIPGFKTAGTFFSKDGMVFCDYTDGTGCLEIGVIHEYYSKLIVQLDAATDPARVASQIQAVLPRSGPSTLR